MRYFPTFQISLEIRAHSFYIDRLLQGTWRKEGRGGVTVGGRGAGMGMITVATNKQKVESKRGTFNEEKRVEIR